MYIYICMYVSTWHKLSTKRACRTPTLLKTHLIRKPLTMQHLSFDPPFLFVATGSPSQKSIMGWIDHCSTTATRSFRIDSTKELQRSTLISWRNDLVETSQAQLQKHHSFWRKFFCFFLKNTTDAIFAEQKMTNLLNSCHVLSQSLNRFSSNWSGKVRFSGSRLKFTGNPGLYWPLTFYRFPFWSIFLNMA